MSDRPTPLTIRCPYCLELSNEECNCLGSTQIATLKRQRDAAVEALKALVSYTEACEGMLNASPAGQVIAARAVLREIEEGKS